MTTKKTCVCVCADEEFREEEPADIFFIIISLCPVQLAFLGNIAREHCGVLAVAGARVLYRVCTAPTQKQDRAMLLNRHNIGLPLNRTRLECSA
jgi:hypothetical protein